MICFQGRKSHKLLQAAVLVRDSCSALRTSRKPAKKLMSVTVKEETILGNITFDKSFGKQSIAKDQKY